MNYRPLEHLDETKIAAATSLRADGNMSLCYGDISSAVNNRRKFLSGLGIDHAGLVSLKQKHGASIACVDRKSRGSGALCYTDALDGFDGLITAECGLPLAIFTADCLAVFLYDPKRPAIGLVHAGWRGSMEDISGRAVRLMRRCFASRPQDIHAGFGPAIGNCCYRVGEEFSAKFDTGLERRGGSLHLDLACVNKKQLLDAGLVPENISWRRTCTFCGGDDFYSFRRQKEACGRMMSVIMLLSH